MNLNKDTYSKSEVAEFTKINENDLYRATNNDSNKPLANYWDGIKHPETGEKLKSDFEYQNNGKTIYAQFSDKEGNSYSYVDEPNRPVDQQVNEDRELANKLEQDRGR